MDHTPQDHQIPGQPSPVADVNCSITAPDAVSNHVLSGLGPLVAYPPDVAATALRDYFLANADRGDNAANDHLIAEMVGRIRALRACSEDGC